MPMKIFGGLKEVYYGICASRELGFEPTTLRDLVGLDALTAELLETMVSKGQFVGLDWNRIARLHSQVMTGTLSQTLPDFLLSEGNLFINKLESVNILNTLEHTSFRGQV